MRKLSLLFIILVLTVLTACNLPIQAVEEQTPEAVAQLIVTADPNSTPTPTPFMPLSPTMLAATNEPTATPALTPQITPAGTVDQPAETTSILVMGSDSRGDGSFRTDTMILVVINMNTGAVSLVSFPRDLYVDIPGIGPQRLNTAQEFGGFPLTIQTFQNNFGVTPDYFVLTDFQGFVNIIDSLGGIQVDASQNLTDTCKLPQAVSGYCSMGPGKIYMNGATALWYVRSRYSSNDFDRTRRQQEVITAVFQKLMSLNAITKIPTLYQEYQRSVDTNIPLDVAVKLATFAPSLIANPDQIHRFAIGSADVWYYVTPGGAQVLLPNPDKIQPILYDAYHVQ
jgi:LCP family protein required for cell wall assembly